MTHQALARVPALRRHRGRADRLARAHDLSPRRGVPRERVSGAPRPRARDQPLARDRLLPGQPRLGAPDHEVRTGGAGHDADRRYRAARDQARHAATACSASPTSSNLHDLQTAAGTQPRERRRRDPASRRVASHGERSRAHTVRERKDRACRERTESPSPTRRSATTTRRHLRRARARAVPGARRRGDDDARHREGSRPLARRRVLLLPVEGSARVRATTRRTKR